MTPSHRPPSEQACAPRTGKADSGTDTVADNDSAAATRDMADAAWVEVITRMDEVYADLVRSQIALEQKHDDLEQAQSFIDSVLKAMSDVLIVVDHSGRIQQVNRALEELVGRSMDELLGTDINNLFSAAARERCEPLIAHWGNDTVIDYEADVVDYNGQPSPMAFNCSPRFDARKRLWGYVVTGRPLGELRRAYAELNNAHENLKNTQHQLIQSEKLASLGLLIAGVAHELNNPISFVFGNMHALKRYGDRFATYLEAIHAGISDRQRQALREELRIDHCINDIGPLLDGTLEGAERVTEIVENLSRFANPKDSRVQAFDLVRLTRTSLHWVVKNGLARSSGQAPSVDLQGPGELTISGKEGQVHQILINLIQNAFDAVEGNNSNRDGHDGGHSGNDANRHAIETSNIHSGNYANARANKHSRGHANTLPYHPPDNRPH